jgi:cell wall assembly regulator SMI1
LIESWSLHDGSNQVGLFPEADDIAYLFMSVEEAAGARRMLMEVEAIDSPSQPSLWTFKIPVAENTAGDYLVIELGSGKEGSISRFSHETTRFRKTAKTFLELLQRVAVEVAQGNLCYDRDSNALA